jgi:hypothetical protein
VGKIHAVAPADRRADRSQALVQEHVPERVLAAGSVSARAEFPPRAWLGVTATRVYAFTSDRGRVGELVGVWDRQDTTVTKAAKLATTRLSLRFGAAGRGVELEARRWGAGNHRLVRYLLDPTRT